jgi:Double zinc ribbon
MSFRKELRVIPRTAWIVAFVCYAGFVILIHFLIPLNATHPDDIGNWPIAGQAAFTLLIPLIFFIFVPLYGYIYGDAKRRGMRYVMWTLLAIFVPDLIGVILYFILRDPVPSECPACHNLVLARFTFCPHCGASVRPTCPQCGRNVETSWVNCGFCGSKLPVQR